MLPRIASGLSQPSQMMPQMASGGMLQAAPNTQTQPVFAQTPTLAQMRDAMTRMMLMRRKMDMMHGVTTHPMFRGNHA